MFLKHPTVRFSLFLFTIIWILPIQSQILPDSLLKSSNAVILKESTSIELKNSKSYVLRYSQKTKILNKRADSYQDIYIHYKESSEQIKDVKITIYDDEGNIVKKVKKKEMEDYASGDGFSIVTDYRVLHWSYTNSSYPIIVEYSYEKKSSNTLSLPRWYPIKGYDVAVSESTYDIIAFSPIRQKEMNIGNYGTISKSDMTYSMNNQKSLNKEKYSPPNHEIFPVVLSNPKTYSFEGYPGEYESWQGYGQWIYDSFLEGKNFEKPENIKQELGSIIDSHDDKREIVEKIYNYVQQNTRYVSIALEEGGLSPMEPQKVHDVKYGDCKALSLYTKCLLDLYDIEANYVEVYANSTIKQDLMADYPCSYPGNHIIVNVHLNNDTIWLDCTSHDNPFNFLGKFTDNRTALAINKTGGKLVNTPIYPRLQNASFDTIVINLSTEEKANVNFKSLAKGLAIENHMRKMSLSNDDVVDYLKDKVYKKQEVNNIDNISISLNEESVSSTMAYTFSLTDYAERLDEYLIIPANLQKLTIPKLPKDKRREHDIDFNREYQENISYIFHLEDSYQLNENPSFEASNEYGKYSLTVLQIDNNTIQIDKSFSLNQARHNAKEYDKIKRFFDKCIKSEKTPISLTHIK